MDPLVVVTHVATSTTTNCLEVTMPILRVSRPRMRSKGSFLPPLAVKETAIKTDGDPNGNWVHVEGYTAPTGTVQVMSDVVQSNFKRRIGEGEVIFNPMEQVSTTVADASRGAKLRGVGKDSIQTYELGSGFALMQCLGKHEASAAHPRLPSWWVNPTDVERCISEATTKAQREPSEANYLVSLAEFRQALMLFPGIWKDWNGLFTKINRSWTARRNEAPSSTMFRKLQSDISDSARTASQTWLALRFGLRPLVSDTVALLKLLKRVYSADPVRLTGRGSSLAKAGSSQSTSMTYGVVKTTYNQSVTAEAHCRAMMLWEVKLDLMRDAGLSVFQVPEAAIDLIRFSFVVNWLVNLNDFFSSLAAQVDPGVRNLGGCYVLTELQSAVWQPIDSTIVPSQAANWTFDRKVEGFCMYKVERKRRLVGLPVPKLTLRGDPLAFMRDPRVVDAITLMHTNLRGPGVRGLLSLASTLNARDAALLKL